MYIVYFDSRGRGKWQLRVRWKEDLINDQNWDNSNKKSKGMEDYGMRKDKGTVHVDS